MRIKKTTKRQLVIQINQARARLALLRRRGYHAQYLYLKKWIAVHSKMVGL